MPAKILVVDDDRWLLWAINTRLQKNAWHCITCDNAIEAMTQFAAGDVDLVITDLTMPGIDGLGLIGLIRSQSDVPIIVVSGHADAYEKLVNQFPKITLMRKPFEPAALIACVIQQVGREVMVP